MRSTFSGFETARSGLFISQRQLDLTGHNIANADTVGYTRQRMSTAAIDPYANAMRFAPPDKGLIGDGVKTIIIDQVRSAYVDRQFRNEHSISNQWDVRSKELSYVEQLFNETEETGFSITQTIADFFASWDEVSKNPEDKGIRSNLQSNGIKLTEMFSYFYTQFEDLQKNENEEIAILVSKVNDVASSIAELNVQIMGFELSGNQANDLRDKRNVLIDELASMVDITYYTDDVGYLHVEVGGEELIAHDEYNAMAVEEGVYNPITDENDLYEVVWENGGDVTLTAGKIRALLDMRDGDTAENAGLPYFIESFNILVRALVEEINAVHSQGYSMDFDGGGSRTGILFFDESEPINAKTFRLSDDVLASPFNIAASSELVALDSDMNSMSGNNIIALEIIALLSRVDLDEIGSFDGYLKGVIVDIAVESSHAQKMYEGQQAISTNLENWRLSVSGVSLDEEMTNLIRFQHAYTASSRVINAMDECLDQLVNRTGMVGR